jgi:hypothetical protein
MSQCYKFTAVIEDAYNGGAFVTVPFDVEKAFGKKRVKVKATIAGIPYRGSLVRMGTQDHILIILKEIREKAGVTFGDEIEIEVEEDKAPREIEVPDDVKAAVSENPKASSFFEGLSYSHQREYMKWVNDAKREETRRKRIEEMVKLLEEGKKGRYL